jgi:hypothetical protein
MRRELFAHHLPNPDRVTADYWIFAGLSRGLSGGDILNVCVNAIYMGSVDADLDLTYLQSLRVGGHSPICLQT